MRTVRCSGHLGGGGCLPKGGVHLPPCGQTDTCKNITTTVADGKNKHPYFEATSA